jgi:DNA-binding MarR family transcriptional regulator
MKPDTAPINALGYLLQHTAGIMYRQSDQVLQERLGIGMSQFKLLMILQCSEPMPQRKLADMLGQTEASISRQVKLLCEKAMLAIKVNPKNRREHIAIATPKGIKLADAARGVLADYHNPILSNCSPKDVDRLLQALDLLHGNVCAKGKPHACGRTRHA